MMTGVTSVARRLLRNDRRRCAAHATRVLVLDEPATGRGYASEVGRAQTTDTDLGRFVPSAVSDPEDGKFVEARPDRDAGREVFSVCHGDADVASIDTCWEVTGLQGA